MWKYKLDSGAEICGTYEQVMNEVKNLNVFKSKLIPPEGWRWYVNNDGDGDWFQTQDEETADLRMEIAGLSIDVRILTRSNFLSDKEYVERMRGELNQIHSYIDELDRRTVTK